MVHIAFPILSSSYLRPSVITSELHLYKPESILCFTVSVIFFDHVQILGKTEAIESTVVSDCMMVI